MYIKNGGTMKSWKITFAVFLLLLFCFFTVVVGGENITEWIKNNLLRLYTYILFSIIILLIVWWLSRNRIYALAADKICLPKKRVYLGRYTCSNGRVLEFFASHEDADDVIVQDSTNLYYEHLQKHRLK